MATAKNRVKRIFMAVTNDLETDRRVDKVCRALSDSGYDVTLIGRRLPCSKPISRPYRTIRMRLLFNKKAIFYVEYNLRIFFKMLFARTDMIYANDIDTLPGCAMAANLRRKKLFLDAHELFSEVPELLERNHIKHIWQWIERTFIPMVDGASTVCQSVADIYKKNTGVEMSIVRNLAPLCNEPVVKKHDNSQKTLLYQGAVNIGRGIDWVIDALEYLDNFRLIVAGDGDILEDLKRKASSKSYSNRISFLGRVLPEELKKITSEADLGLVLLENMGLNYYYSLPNRLSDFVQAGVPVIATNFPEIENVVISNKTGSLISCDEAKSPMILAQKIKFAIDYWEQIPDSDYCQIFSVARKNLCWENEKKSLINTIDTIFSKK